MERRKFLATTVGAGSVIGLAGCAGGDNGDSDDSTDDSGDEEDIECSQPASDNLEGSLPDSDDYEQQGEVFTTAGEDQEDIEGTAFAGYSGPDGGDFLFAVTEYSSLDVASEQAESVTDEDAGDYGALGYIQTGAFIFVGGGPDKNSIGEFMGTSPTLEGCVRDSIELIEGSTPTDQ